ncbi:hypothetical protein [Brevundimonas sp.]|uniref:hypothetical protein n=1 Tax=Brevundimonas sp. TaxID=1871086 RepID=UPI0025C2BBEC|nr:hypothetical protein [Brevundimonas sp.]
MSSSVRASRWISLIAVGLTLSSCSDGGFNGPTREFSGVWLYEFEGSSFVEGASEMPTERPPYEETDWLEWTDWPRLEALMEESLGNEDCYTVQPFLITFVGRRTHPPFGGAGHLGGWRSQVTVHRPISAERLGPSFCYGD